MKRKFRGLTVLFYVLSAITISFLSSCRSSKDLTILQNVRPTEPNPLLPPDYIIKDNDNLFISIVSNNREMNDLYNPSVSGTGRANVNNLYNEVVGQYIFGYTVDEKGDVTLPLMGKVNVKGLSFREAEASIGIRAKEFLKEFTVKVRLLNFRVTVLGEVTHPGVYYNYNAIFTVLDAISTASGTSNFADLKKVLVLRSTTQGSQSFYLDLTTKESLSSPAFYLKPNDMVFLQPARYKNVQLRTPIISIALSTIAAVLLLVNILDK